MVFSLVEPPVFPRESDRNTTSGDMDQFSSPEHRALRFADGEPSATEWLKVLAAYRDPSPLRSIVEIVITVVPLAALWFAMWASLGVGYWLTLLLAIPTAGFLMRLFVIQHDCGHSALFRRRSVNDWVGRAAGIVTMTPYYYWRRIHAMHHATSGNLEERGIGDVWTLTVAEYLASPGWRRLLYRVFRSPAVLLVLGPPLVFFAAFRIPGSLLRVGWQPWVSTMGTNAGIALVAVAMTQLVGLVPFLLVYVPTVALAAALGCWLFFVQHQFEDTVWEPDEAWDQPETALHGSSFYDLPKVLHWLTGNIGLHHVHHLSSRIPFYRLPEVMRDRPELAAIGRIGLVESFHCIRLALWDENRRRLISFREMRDPAMPAPATAAAAQPGGQ
jgi:omega-6 fatty acid desaturase (delta-12 desaturase)